MVTEKLIDLLTMIFSFISNKIKSVNKRLQFYLKKWNGNVLFTHSICTFAHLHICTLITHLNNQKLQVMCILQSPGNRMIRRLGLVNDFPDFFTCVFSG